MTKQPRVYKPRLVGSKVMMPADLERLHKYMLEIEESPSSRLGLGLTKHVEGEL